MNIEWSKNMYYGEKAVKGGMKGIRKYLPSFLNQDFYFITKPSNEKNLLDIISVKELEKDIYRNKPLYVVGIANGYNEALETAARIVNDTYKTTGRFEINL